MKKALAAAQHNKCCFCERKIGLDGDVEHFRPKAGCCQGKRHPILKPGYYWLAYDWANLLLSCPICNQRFKRNLFPLVDPAKRARSHQDNIADEEPLFINPAEQDPERFISFHKEIPYAIRDNPYGKATIEALGLDREILNEVRRDRLSYLIHLRKVLDCEAKLSETAEGRQLLIETRAMLAEAVSDAAEFAAMARAAAKLDFQISLP